MYARFYPDGIGVGSVHIKVGLWRNSSATLSSLHGTMLKSLDLHRFNIPIDTSG